MEETEEILVDPTAVAELQQSFAEEQAARTKAEQQAVQFAEQLKESNERLARMEADARTRRFTELVEGDKRWSGATETHLKVLNAFAQTFGENSDEFSEYVRLQNAVAQQIADSALFSEKGSTSVEPLTAGEEMDKRANELAKQKGITFQQAFVEVVQADPSLYDRHLKGE